MYLIDTDTIIYAMKGHPQVLARLRETVATPKAISVVTYGELMFSAMRSQRVQENLAHVRRITEVYHVIEVTRSIMASFVSLKAELAANGTPVPDMDLMIASTAIELGYRLVTNNERHFRPVPGLQIENWAK